MTDSDPAGSGSAEAVMGRDLAARTDPRVVRWLAGASRVIGVMIAVLGLVVIAGWFSGIAVLTTIRPNLADMKFNAAVGVTLVGVGLVSLGYARRPVVVWVGRVAAATAGFLGLVTLVEYGTGRDVGIDHVFRFAQAGPSTGRMAEPTALCLAALAVSILALSWRLPRVGQLAGLVALAVALLALVGYAFGVAELYTVGAYSPMAVHTALAFVLGGLAVLCARSDEGFVALVTEDSAGGVMVRRLLVPAVVCPAIAGGVLDWAASTSALSTQFALATFTVSMVVLTTALVWIIGSGLRHVDLRRAGAEGVIAELRASEERFRTSVEHLHEALSVFSAVRDDNGQIVDLRWEFANSAQSLLTGTRLVGRTLMEVLPNHGPSGTLATYRNVIETGEPYVEPSLWLGNEWGDGRRHRRAFDVRATKFGDGLVVVTREVTERREQDQELARQRRELERSNTEVKLLNGLGDMLQSCASADEAYSVVTQSCIGLFPAFSGSISVMHASRDVLDVVGNWGAPVEMHSFAPIDCWALRRGRPYVSGAIGPRCGHLDGSTAMRCLCAPMLGQSEMIGVVHLTSPIDDPATGDDLDDGPTRQLAITVAGQMSMAFANLRLRDSLREMSIRDPLTGLFNRRYMEESLSRELSRSQRDNTSIGVLVIDVDHFKAFNDTHGHEGGDVVLEAVAAVLSHYSRSSDIACRYGGEEFVVILPDCSLDDARLRAEEFGRRVSGLRVPFANIELSGPTVSCGVAGFPLHGLTAEALIHAADGALYAAKKGGRNQVVIAPLLAADAVDVSAVSTNGTDTELIPARPRLAG